MAGYAEYEFYLTQYGGSAIAELDWPRVSLLASATISRLTFARAAVVIEDDDDDEKIQAIKLAVCAVAEEINLQAARKRNKAIASESVGQHSVTYAREPLDAAQDDTSIYAAARLFLGSTFLMYKGLEDADEQ